MISIEEYLIYLRKSRADVELEARGEGETLARHEKALSEFARKHHLNVTAIYKEIVSGETISERPKMQQLITEVMSGRWAGVLVMEVERLARGDTKDQGIVSEAFKIGNTKIITPTKTYDPNNEFDEEYFEFGLFMSRREYKTINRRIQRGRVASAKEGKFLSSVAPYGYKKVKIPNDKGYTLEIDPERADVIRLIFRWYVDGCEGTRMGMTSIARKLDEMRIPPMRRDTWSRASISDILQNPVYAGKLRWSYRKEIKKYVDGQLKKIRTPSTDCIYVDGIHPAIITEETFERVQQIMKQHNRNPISTPANLQNPLAGLIYCKKCGALMTRLAPSTKTPYAALKCPNRYCNNISSPLYLVEEVLISSLRSWLEKYEMDCATSQHPELPQVGLLKSNVSKLQGELKGLNDQKNNAYDFLEKGIYTVEIFQGRLELLSRKEFELKKDLEELDRKLSNLYAAEEAQKAFAPAAKEIMEAYEGIEDAAAKNELLKKVLERAEYEKTEPNRKGNRENANFSLDLYPRIITIDL
ncbi:recombinase family protein [Hominifimenecus sp. rT4P-3]|uniref:recombinase family protein n=1 Tax=Hominifimenecus sp. rT4P-3 TaxID=3242979 RepID=UPI003DA57E47